MYNLKNKANMTGCAKKEKDIIETTMFFLKADKNTGQSHPATVILQYRQLYILKIVNIISIYLF